MGRTLYKNYVDDDVSLYNNHKGISEDNQKDVKMIWDEYNDNMGEYVDVACAGRMRLRLLIL